MSLSLYFFFPVQLRRGSDRAALVGTWPPARVNPRYQKAEPWQGEDPSRLNNTATRTNGFILATNKLRPELGRGF